MDYEALFPFPVLTILIWPAGTIRSRTGLLIVGSVIVTLGQLTVLSRTISQPKGERLRYFATNEIGLACSVFAILGVQLAMHSQ
jgi:hypothetical protein